MYGEFANYITEVVKHFDEELGIRFRTLSPINEPVDPVWYNGNGQEGCTYDRGSQNKILKEVGKQLVAKGLNTKLSGPEENSIDKTRDSYRSYDSETKAYISQINTHSYAGTDRTTMKTIAINEGKTLWQSEYGTGGDWRESGSHDHDGYGSRNINHGIMGISIDDRPEVKYDAYKIPREDNVLIYTSPILPLGEHTLKVRVTGEKSWASTGYNVIADRVDVINTVPTDMNLAVGKPATASSEQIFNKNTAYNGNDANLSTRWAANIKNLGQWWEADLGDYYKLTGSELTWEFDGKLYKYKIEVSSDRVNWKVALDKTTNTVTTQVQKESFSVDNARYVRVTITEHQSWPSFYEFKVFGY